MSNAIKITLISHVLCPYVQRAVIVLKEKNIDYERIDIDLAHKPDWFLNISPLGKTPVLKVGEVAIYESNVILEYLEEALPGRLHPQTALERAAHRSMIEFGSAILSEIAGLYMAKTQAVYEKKKQEILEKFIWVEKSLQGKEWYGGADFSLVDAVYGPIFRYFDMFEKIGLMDIFADLPKLRKWRDLLSGRASVQQAVSGDYPENLWKFLKKKDSYLSSQM